MRGISVTRPTLITMVTSERVLHVPSRGAMGATTVCAAASPGARSAAEKTQNPAATIVSLIRIPGAFQWRGYASLRGATA